MDWNGYNDHLKNLMIRMITTTEYSDVTLVCDDSDFQFKTHKSILSACSPELEKIIRKTSEQNPVIYLRGIHSKEMEALIQFMYLGRTTIAQKDLPDLLKVAQDLKIKGICDKETEESRYSPNETNTEDEVMFIDKSTKVKGKKEFDAAKHKQVISQQQTMMVNDNLDENVLFENENMDFKRTIKKVLTKVNEDYDSSFDFSFEQLFPEDEKSKGSSPKKTQGGSENVDVKEEKVLPAKRGRGRPRKGEIVIKQVKSLSGKRGRGRPIKVFNEINDNAVVGRKKDDLVVKDPLAQVISPFPEFNITV